MTDELHTTEQKRAKARGLVEAVKMFKHDFDTGLLTNKTELNHHIENLNILAEQVNGCINENSDTREHISQLQAHLPKDHIRVFDDGAVSIGAMKK